MKFDKKFDVKKLIKVSAVALAMISAGGIASTVNANTNAHADSASIDLVPLNSKEHKQDVQDERADKEDDKREVHEGQEYMKQHHIKPTDQGFVLPANGSKPSVSKSKVSKHVHKHVSKRARLSKAMIRKIMNQINADKRAIRNDKKHLSTRNARKFMRNYTRATKSVKRAKREQKRAMATKDAKRYLRYYKDEVKHEKDLVRLTKSTHASKATKRNARKSLKRVRKNIRKNRKNVKRAHKVIRAHKHGRKARK